MSRITLFFISVFGILLPWATLAIEFFSQLSGSGYFDPIPTPWHIVAVAFVPLANSAALYFLKRQGRPIPNALGLINAIAVTIAALYTLPYLPLLPFALPAVLLYGMGLLPLTPLLSCLSAILLRRSLKKAGLINARGRVPGLLYGMLIVIFSLFSLEFQPAITEIGLSLAASEKASTSMQGINLLRTLGHEDTLLAACYGRRGRIGEPLSALFRSATMSYLSEQEAQHIYFRVTGKSHQSVRPPRQIRRYLENSGWWFDENRGQNQIGARINNLSLSQSNLAGSVDPDAALSYTEWTLVFENKTRTEQEARTRIALPPGAKVSRLTLWVHGEEREAAFASRAQTTQAYQRVVNTRRDPALVTSDGPDRILLQVFPVPANGGTMKVKLGMTAPLHFTDNSKSQFLLPTLRERNFHIPESLQHDIWIDSTGTANISEWKLSAQQTSDHAFSYRGQLSTAQLGLGNLSFPTPKNGSQVYTIDRLTSGKSALTIQTVTLQPRKTSNSIIAVIDASTPVDSKRKNIIEQLSTLAGKATLTVLLASDTVNSHSPFVMRTFEKSSTSFREDVRDFLESMPFLGGQDNLPALVRALDLSGDQNLPPILWLHGPQPFSSPSDEALLQRIERLKKDFQIYDLELAPGENHILKSLDRTQVLQSAGESPEALAQVLNRLTSAQEVPTLVRIRQEEPFPLPENAHHTSDHLARLWAIDEMSRLMQLSGKEQQAEGLRLATQYRLVTPFSGAVVLETTAQYEQSGLTPPESLHNLKVPSIPEPETYLLMAIVAGMLLISRRRTLRLQGEFV